MRSAYQYKYGLFACLINKEPDEARGSEPVKSPARFVEISLTREKKHQDTGWVHMAVKEMKSFGYPGPATTLISFRLTQFHLLKFSE